MQAGSREAPKSQRSLPRTFAAWLRVCNTREEAMLRAHQQSGLTMTAIGEEARLTVARVSQLIAKAQVGS
jgi:putative transposase